MRLSRRSFVAVAGTVALAGCLTGDGDGGGLGNYDPGTDETSTATPEAMGSGGTTGTATEARPPPGATDPPDGATTRTDPTIASGDTATSAAPGEPYDTPPAVEPRLPLPMSREDLRSEAISGGPPKDGIPSIDDPSFVGAGGADLDDGDIVFGLERGGAVRAYPQSILVHHEICNDTVAGDAVSVTYCPLTGTAMGFARGDTTFGVSGRLINNNLVMYDRTHEAWWPQVLASSIPGPWEASPPAASLREFRLVWTTWGQWRDLHPDTRVLSRETGYIRNYDRDPYGTYNPKGGYYENERTLFPGLNPDDRFHPKRMVLGARAGDGAAAFPRDTLREKGTIAGELGGEPVVAVHDPRLGTGHVYRNPDGEDVTVEGDQVAVDGSAHAADALPLDRVYAFDAMWFAWHGFYPDTTVHE